MDNRRLRTLARWSDASHSKLGRQSDDFHSGKPDPEVLKIAANANVLFGKGAHILDVGGGQGRNALPFLTRDHRVVITELSRVALQAAKQKAAALNVAQHLETEHVRRFDQTVGRGRKAHVVVCSRVLQNYLPQHRDTLIRKMQTRTRVGGFNVIVTHLKHGATRGAFANADELKRLYTGWKVTCTVGKVEYAKIGGLKLGRSVTLVARKA